jgi:hypothetical protein
MTKKTKKINPKDTQKTAIKDILKETLTSFGTIAEGKDYGFTKDTLVLHAGTCDVQIKLITPKTGVLRYEAVEEE